MKSLKEKQSKEYHDTLLLLRKYRDVRWSLEAVSYTHLDVYKRQIVYIENYFL